MSEMQQKGNAWREVLYQLRRLINGSGGGSGEGRKTAEGGTNTTGKETDTIR